MLATAKIFTSGNSQALRLPKAFRFDPAIREVQIRKNESTGELAIIPIEAEEHRRERLQKIFDEIKAHPFPEDFLMERRNEPMRNPFADDAV